MKTRRLSRLLWSSLLVLVLAGTPLLLHGIAWGDSYWAGSESNDNWTESSNWDGGVPGSGTNAFIDNGTNQDVTQPVIHNGDAAVAYNFTLGLGSTDSGYLHQTPAGTLSVGGNMVVGDAGTGYAYNGQEYWYWDGGTINVTGNLTLGNQSGSYGSMENFGTIAVTGNMTIGAQGTGHFSNFNAANVNPSLTVSGSLTVGDQGIGTLTMGGWSFENSKSPTLTVGDPNNPQNMVVGATATGHSANNGTYDYHGLVSQSSSVVTVYGNLVLGQNGDSGNGYGPAIGVYELNYGSLHVAGGGDNGNLYVGYGGAGTFHHNGNDVTVDNTLVLGHQTGSQGTYNLDTGYLYIGSTSPVWHGNLYVGDAGTGTFNQTGGYIWGYGQQVIGNTGTGTGTFNLSGDGWNRTATLILGNNANSSGTYNLNGGTLEVYNNEFIGNSGSGTFIQTNGSQEAGDAEIVLGRYANSSGTYTMTDGSLKTGTLTVGGQGTGSFTQTGTGSQTGGNVTVYNDMNIGTDPAGSGTYTMSRGTLTTTDLTVGSTGTMKITNASAQVNVGGNLTINAQGKLDVASGVIINMTGANFYDYNPDDDLSNLKLFFSNSTASDILGFAGTLKLGTLELTDDAILTLMDLAPDPPTLTLSYLYLGDNAILYLNGLTLDCLTENEFLGSGAHIYACGPPAVPLPGSAWLLLSGLAGLGLMRRKWRLKK
jgi:fibronectin-binding autotransporter adhesin